MGPLAGEKRGEPNQEPIKLRWPLGHYYSPVPDTRRLALRRFRLRVWPPKPHPTPGIDWRGPEQLALCRELAAQDPLEFPAARTADETEYFKQNQMFLALDAWVLQAMLRHLEPARVIEVGSGYSSLVTARVNRECFGGRIRFTCIDPHVSPFLRAGVPGITEMRTEEVQDTPLELFAELTAGDVLFIDTSHTVKTGGEVPWIYNQVLPLLGAGVAVHLHDVFLPGDYPEQWVMEGRAWNELYLIESFLAFNAAFEILFGARWMIQHAWPALVEAFPAVTAEDAELAGSLWLRRT
jgi:predicted O-methyltransferase YrrM